MRLRRLDSGALLTLAAQHRVGRSRSANLRLDSGAVSAEHALISWDGSAWLVRDLGSRNGTTLNGRRLEAQARFALATGDRLSFGDAARELEVVDAHPPVAMAEDGGGRLLLAEHGLLALPAAGEAEVVIYQDPERGWLLERLHGAEGVRTPVADQAVVSVSGSAFRLFLPEVLNETEACLEALELERLSFEFRVSADEEDVTLRLLQGTVERELPARSFHYVLLVLGRLRVADAGGDDPEAGWVDVELLLRMLKTTRRQLNLAIFRARQQFAEAGVQNAADLVERRPNADRLRLCTARVLERRV